MFRLDELKAPAVAGCALVAAGLLAAASCGASARLPVAAGTGPRPAFPPEDRSLIPVINVVSAKGWAPGQKPVAGEGATVAAFAQGLAHPRWLYVLPNGDVLVAETNAPPRPKDNTGIKGWFFKRYQKKAGGAAPSANRVTLLRDADGDGVAETRTVFLSGLNAPFGMALVGDTLYVANTDAVVAFPYSDGQTTITAKGTKLADLPAGLRNHHWTKSLIASADGTKLYVGVGSNSNVAEHGMAEEEGRAAVWEIDRATGRSRVWTQHVDTRVKPQRLDLVARATIPDYALGPHTASLGLAFAGETSLPGRLRHGMFVGQHGSWNRKPRSGYKVVFVPFAGGRPSGEPIDVLTGFVKPNGDAMGRPVGVAIDGRGGLLVADDVGNSVWRVAGSSQRASEP